MPIASFSQDAAAPTATPETSAADSAAPAQDATDKPVTADTVVATVGGTDITLGHLVTARASLPEQYQQMPANLLFPGLLSQLINQTVLEQAFTGEVPKGVQVSLDNTRRSMMAAVSLADYLETAVTDEMVQKEYNAEYGDGYEPKEEYHAAHILVKTEDEAKDLIKQYNDGTDFGKLARDNSTGPSGPNGGDLGWFSEGMMVKPFEDAVKTLEPGQVSEPVQTQFGWHVIELIETRKQAPELADVEGEIRSKLQEQVTNAYIDELVAKADVDKSASEGIDPSVLDNTGLLE
ncbi:peptidylprolyl isomerase [Pseudooceanicola sediminis]|uniref:Parvulin-like PPIase n=2 Tax=Pseudooceanicola sediminis TaxID=2211117 RepID=A0A399J8D3_9RHOB|nr:peptidylprolyl isomerase [Puniceibacterium sp. HSS470]RII40449.1 peptidylprolyl isomerase [Pseudooceanicola sediminis]